MAIIMSATISANFFAFDFEGARLQTPSKPLKTNALEITTQQPKDYCSWSAKEDSASFSLLKKAAAFWKEKQITEQYFVYGKQDLENNGSFSWQALPYYKTNNTLSRIWQQIVVLWRVVFGGFEASKDYIQQQSELYTKDFAVTESKEPAAEINLQPGKDPFCDKEKIAKQSVFEGHNIRILYNYAPIGFGGERLHFLIVPKRHVADFAQLTNDEYAEAADLSKKLITHFKNDRKSQEAYLFWKYGEDAGQTVDHCHLHVILTANKAQSTWGKLTVLKNILFGSSPLSADQLKTKVEALKKELGELSP